MQRKFPKSVPLSESKRDYHKAGFDVRDLSRVVLRSDFEDEFDEVFLL